MNNSISDGMTGSEKEVEDYLRKLMLIYLYEQPVFVTDDKDRPRIWTPDFYLPELGIYIEVCGTKKFDYDFREKIYEKNNTPIIFIHQYKNPAEWQGWLKKEIIRIHKEREKKVNGLE